MFETCRTISHSQPLPGNCYNCGPLRSIPQFPLVPRAKNTALILFRFGRAVGDGRPAKRQTSRHPRPRVAAGRGSWGGAEGNRPATRGDPRGQARRRAVEHLTSVPATLVFMEAARRLPASLADMADVLGARPAAVAVERGSPPNRWQAAARFRGGGGEGPC